MWLSIAQENNHIHVYLYSSSLWDMKKNLIKCCKIYSSDVVKINSIKKNEFWHNSLWKLYQQVGTYNIIYFRIHDLLVKRPKLVRPLELNILQNTAAALVFLWGFIVICYNDNATYMILMKKIVWINLLNTFHVPTSLRKHHET